MNGESPPRKRRRVKIFLFIIVAIALVLWFRPGDGAGTFLPDGNPEIGRIDLRMPIFSSESVLDSFRIAEQSSKLKVLILRIDSPGGLVASSQEIYRRIGQFKERKRVPVIASVENVCASGAYYVACAADTIIVNPGSQVGSIGVIVDLLNVRELMDKFGIDARTIKTGRLKDAGDPTKRLTAEEVEIEKKYFKGIIDAVLEQFIADVASSRKMSAAKVRDLAHGGIFTGSQAVENGLADSSGNYVDAVVHAARIAGLDPLRAMPVTIEPPDRRGFVERALFGERVSWPGAILGLKHVLALLP